MEDITKIYLVRHAEAEGNLYRRIQGQYNSRITVLGEKQLDALADRFKDISYDAVISSDLLRARCTAERLADIHGLKLVENALLREISVGCWEDRPWGNLALEYPEQMNNFINNIESFSVEGSETIASVKGRIKKAIVQIANEYRGKTVVLVSHGTAINAFLSDVLGITFSEVKRNYGSGDNTAVNLLHVKGNDIEVCYVNDASHLTESISTYFRQKKWRNSVKQRDGVYFVQVELEYVQQFCLDLPDIKGGSLHIMAVRIDDNDVGFIVLDVSRCDEKIGEIIYCWIKPQYRGRRIGIQLIGHAVSVFRKLGRDYIVGRVNSGYKESLGFFENAGFRKFKKNNNEIEMILDIAVR